MKTLEALETLITCLGIWSIILAINDNMLQTLLVSDAAVAFAVQSVVNLESIIQATNWKFRQKASSGSGLITGSVLLPLALVAHGTRWCPIDMSCRCSYQLSSIIISIFLLFSIALPKYFPKLLRSWLSSSVALVSALVGIYTFMRFPHWVVACGSFLIGGSILAMVYLHHLMGCLSESFTLGEVMLISQGLSILSLEALWMFPSPVPDTRKFGACLQVLVVGIVLVGLLLRPILSKVFENCVKASESGAKIEKNIKSWTWSLYFYLLFAAANLLFLLPWLGLIIQENPVIYGLKFMFAFKERVFMMVAWTILVTIAGLIVATTTSSSTVIRKYFHLIAVATFIPGLHYDPELLCLASAGVFFIFIFLEGIRAFKIQPFGSYLYDAFKIFLDEQDSGLIILTHIYLLLGLSLPLWIFSDGEYLKSGEFLPLYSGVLSIGVGDTAASVFGSLLGRHKWTGTKKTLEGTVAAVVSQVITCYFLQSILGVRPQGNWLLTLWAIFLTSLLEAFTSQIDNLILPMFMFSLLSIKL